MLNTTITIIAAIILFKCFRFLNIEYFFEISSLSKGIYHAYCTPKLYHKFKNPSFGNRPEGGFLKFVNYGQLSAAKHWVFCEPDRLLHAAHC